MTVNISFEQIKKAAAIALLAGNLFAIGAAVNYTLWRVRTTKAFTLLDFDIQSRLPQIRAAILARQAEEAAKEAAIAKGIAEHAPDAAAPPTTVPQTTHK